MYFRGVSSILSCYLFYSLQTIQTIQDNTIHNTTQYKTIHNTRQVNTQYKTIQYTIQDKTIHNTRQDKTIHNTRQDNTQYKTNNTIHNTRQKQGKVSILYMTWFTSMEGCKPKIVYTPPLSLKCILDCILFSFIVYCLVSLYIVMFHGT